MIRAGSLFQEWQTFTVPRFLNRGFFLLKFRSMAKKTTVWRGQGSSRRKKSKGITLTTDQKLQLLKCPDLDDELKKKILNS